MTVLYTQAQQKQVRVTLTLSVQDDFNPRQIDWRKLFELEDNEQVESYIEELKKQILLKQAKADTVLLLLI